MATWDSHMGLEVNGESKPQRQTHDNYRHMWRPSLQSGKQSTQCWVPLHSQGKCWENILRADQYQRMTPHCYCQKCSQHFQRYTPLKQARPMLVHQSRRISSSRPSWAPVHSNPVLDTERSYLIEPTQVRRSSWHTLPILALRRMMVASWGQSSQGYKV